MVDIFEHVKKKIRYIAVNPF